MTLLGAIVPASVLLFGAKMLYESLLFGIKTMPVESFFHFSKKSENFCLHFRPVLHSFAYL